MSLPPPSPSTVPTWVAPPADLRDWTDGAVVVRSPASQPASCFPALVGSMLVLRLAGDVRGPGPGLLPAAALIGPSTRPSRFVHAGAVHAVGLLVRPEALAALLPGQVAGLVDGHAALADLDGLGGHAWACTLQAMQAVDSDNGGDSVHLALLFAQLRHAVAGLGKDQRRQQLACLAQAIEGPLDQACRNLALSRRQLARLSLAHFGLVPKQFQTISRLQRALHGAADAGAPAGVEGADLALQAGYYDQSHLGRDLRRLAGQPLGRLLDQARQPGGAHWPLAVGWQLSAPAQPEPAGGPAGTAAAQPPGPPQNRPAPPARAGAHGAPTTPRR